VNEGECETIVFEVVCELCDWRGKYREEEVVVVEVLHLQSEEAVRSQRLHPRDSAEWPMLYCFVD
jgi:predicted kinase